MAEPAAGPKLDFKMLILPVVLLASKKIDMNNPEIINTLRGTFLAVSVIACSVYYMVYLKIQSKKEDKVIWVPPKAKPSLPFGLGPQPEPVKPDEYEETTYQKHETTLLIQALQSIATSAAIAFFMSFKFNIHMSFIIQSIMTPLNIYEMAVVKKHLLGQTKNADGKLLYNELFRKPTAESLAMAERVAAAQAAGAVADSGASDNEPRVVELTDGADADGDKNKKSDSKAETKAIKTETKVNEID